MSEHHAGEQIGHAIGLIKQGKLPAAEALLESICKNNSNDGKAWFVWGSLRAECGDTNRAIEYLSTAVHLEPDNTEAHFALCKLHLSNGNLAASIHHVEAVVAQDPKHAHAWLALGSLYADTGRLQQSVHASRIAVELLPGIAEPRINLANALISQGEHDEAAALCHQVMAENPARPGIWHSLGLAFKTLGRPAAAEQCLTTLVQMAPDHAEAYSALGEVKAAKGELSQALSLYQRARTLAPADPIVNFQIGKVQLPASSPIHASLVERLQEDHQYHDASEASDIARQLAAGFRYGNSDVELALVRFFEAFDPLQLYPAEWWVDALVQFGDPRHAPDTALRSVFSTVFSFSLPCQQALDEVAAFCGKRMASYGSGAGYWEWLLATYHGIEVSCHDITLRHRFLPMQKSSHADADVVRGDTIFLAWLPGDAAIDVAIESLLDRVSAGQKLVLVGEPPDATGQPRTCGTQRFFRYVKAHFESVGIATLVNYAYLHDRVELLVKRSV